MAETGCKTCKQKSVRKTQIGIIILGFYLLFSAGYGTYKLVLDLINYIK
jgi:hypothetical protein